MIKRIIKYIDKKYLNGFISRAIPKTGFLSAKKLDKDPLSCNQFSDYFFDSSIKKQLEYVDPKGIITSDRLDVIVRYLFFKNLAYGKLSKEIESLYCRTILSRTGAIEPTDYYSPEEKIGIDSHIQSAKNLLDSIKENGFKQEYYIPIAKDYGLYNGAHRIAAGIALNQNVWIKYEGEHGVKNLDFEWFVDNGFSIEDQLRVLRGFADIYTNCGIFVLFGTCKSEWEYIIKRIGRSLHIVGSLDLDFSKDYLAFENLIHDIYLDYDNTSAIERKIELLKFAKLIVRVVVVSDEHHKSNDFYNDMVNIKTDIRNSLDSKYPANAFITLHGSDNREEFIHMKNILLSVNNLRCLGMRCKTNVRDEFLNWIVKYKQYCKNHGIDTNDACIIGSSPLEVMGIRNSTDIDIVISPELRKVYGDGIVHLTEELDIANRNYVKNEKNGEIYIFDEQLIYDDNYHFIFCGCKFANNECHHETWHNILFVKSISGHCEEISWYQEYSVLQCAGCDTICYRTDSSDSESYDVDEYGHWIPDVRIENFPYSLEGIGNIENIYELPTKIKSIYSETLKAISDGCFTLAGIGLRATVEAICEQENIKGSNLNTKINRLLSNGIISKDEAGKLHAIRFIGNDAAHDIKVPFKNQIILALKIIEHLLSSKYAMQDEIEKYLEMPLDCYEVFKKFVNKKVLETKTTFSLQSLISSDKRRCGDKYNEFIEKYEKEIEEGKVTILEDITDQIKDSEKKSDSKIYKRKIEF